MSVAIHVALVAPRCLGLGDDVSWASACLAQDAADIFADDTEHEKLHRAEDGNRRHDRGPAGRSRRVLHKQEAYDRIDDEQAADHGEAERKPDSGPQWPNAM